MSVSLPPLEALEKLDKEDLIQIIRELAARVAELEARQKQNSKNSSKPPSSDPPFRPLAPKNASNQTGGTGKKSGGQPGHEGHGLKKVASPAHRQPHLPSTCRHCGYALDQDSQASFRPCGAFQVFDLPARLTIEVTEHRRFVACCPWCQKETVARLPRWLSVETPCQWGPHCRALGVYLMQQQHLPYERTQALFTDLFGAAPSEGTLFAWLTQAHQSLEPVEAQIAKALLESEQVGADETPARGAGWLHCLVNEDFTWYGCHEKRGREAMGAFGLLPRYQGLLMSDCLASYTIYGKERSLCCAHLLRDLQAVCEAGHRWADQMRRLLLDAKERVETTGAPLARSTLHALYRRFGKILALAARENGERPVEKSWSVLSRLEAYRDQYLRFAVRADAWFDNNISERALRMRKLHVKVSGCFRSSRGCQILCRVRGYLSTMQKQGQPLLAALVSVMERNPLMPPLRVATKN